MATRWAPNASLASEYTVLFRVSCTHLLRTSLPIIVTNTRTILTPQLFHLLPKQADPKLLSFILPRAPQPLINAPYRPLAKLFLKILQKVRRMLVPLIPRVIDFDFSLPVRRAQVTVEPDPVRDSLDQSTGRAAVGIPLVAVDELVREDAGEFGGEARGWRGGDVGGDVGEGEVDFLVVGVEVGLFWEGGFSFWLYYIYSVH